MISSQDRSYYIGASDTAYVVGNWTTKSFDRWYGTKLGIYEQNFTNDAMRAGTNYEHKILESLGIPNLRMDNQIIQGRLRVNLDGNTDDTIYEVKTHSNDKPFKVSKSYQNQVNVEMYAFNYRRAFIVAYGLEEKDYINYYRDIDPKRLYYHPIQYDESFINNEYLPKLMYLSECLDNGTFPKSKFKGE
jgi:hypothetical protein